MPLVIDDSLDPSLFPLAWIVGTWEGTGAVQLIDEHGDEVGRGIEQRITVVPNSNQGLEWTMRTWVLDAPAPEPPTSAFYDTGSTLQDASNETPDVIRELLLEESGTWRTQGLLPGQDEARAQAAKPGSPESFLSHAATLTMRRSSAFGVSDAEHWAGEVRGPRIQLASQDLVDPHRSNARICGTRMFGLVGGKLMWLQEIGATPTQLRPYISVELERAEELSEEEVQQAVNEARSKGQSKN